MLSGGWGSSLIPDSCCTFVLHEDQNGRFLDRNQPLTCVELRGFEPLTPSMRTRCATGLRYSPWNSRQRSKHRRLLARRAVLAGTSRIASAGRIGHGRPVSLPS